ALLDARVNSVAVVEPLAKMRRENAHAAFVLETLLISRVQELGEFVGILGVRAGEPPGHERPRRIAVRNRRVDRRRVDVIVREVPGIREVASAEVTPPVRGAFYVSLKIIACSPTQRAGKP